MLRSLYLLHFCVVLLYLFVYPVSTFPTAKFIEWFPQSHPTWINGPCKSLYERGRCGDILNCILEHTSELRKTTIGAAQVMLGVTPALLSNLGSSVAEMSLVAFQRPFLSLLLVLGAPAMYQTRISEYEHPYETLETVPRGFGAEKIASSRQMVIFVSQYCIAAAAAANNLELALRIGSHSVLVWACRSWYMPLVWILFSLVAHVTASLSYYVLVKRERHQHSNPTEHPADTGSEVIEWRQHSRNAQTSKQLCSGEPKTPSAVAISLQVLASCFAFMHVVLGTLILSSLTFIGFHDTILILGRLLASALVCRAISLYQLMCTKKSVAKAR